MDASGSNQRCFYQAVVAPRAYDWLQAACDVAGSVAGDAGAEHGAVAVSGERLEQQVNALREWADHSGLLIEPTQIPPRFQGGREHHLIDPQSASDRIVKITIGPEFGFYATCLPRSQYPCAARACFLTRCTPQSQDWRKPVHRHEFRLATEGLRCRARMLKRAPVLLKPSLAAPITARASIAGGRTGLRARASRAPTCSRRTATCRPCESCAPCPRRSALCPFQECR